MRCGLNMGHREDIKKKQLVSKIYIYLYIQMLVMVTNIIDN